MKCRRSTFGFSVPIEFEFDCMYGLPLSGIGMRLCYA